MTKFTTSQHKKETFSFVLHSIFRNFATMNNQEQPKRDWSENVIIADADFVDSVAFNLIVNFERMIDRRISRADLAQWAECVALDGGVRPDDQQKTDTRQQTHVVLIHDKGTRSLENFSPSDLEEEINAQAFESTLGEFTFSVVNAEGLATKEDFFTDTLRLVAGQKDVKRIMVIPDERYYDDIRDALRNVDDDSKRITVFAMQPMPGGNFRQEILGYSLMQALGIHADEIK